MKNIYLKTAEALRERERERERESCNLKNGKGITLIALVLTIIILLLLAGISINMIAGQDGILTKVSNAKKEMNKAELEEKIGLAVAEWELEKGSNSNYNTTLEEHLKTKTDIKSNEPLTWISGDNVVNIDSNNNLTVNSKSRNLIKNGYLENKNNYNFTKCTYNQNGYFSYSTNEQNINKQYMVCASSEFIPIDISKKYREKVIARCNNQKADVYMGLGEYDIDYNHIDAFNCLYVGNTLTYLTRDLKDGDTEIYLNDISNFIYNKTTDKYHGGLIFWNYKDSTGYQYEPLTYSRNVWNDLYVYDEQNPAIDKENNVIKLKEPWSKGTILEGTQVSQSSNSSTYNYGLYKGRLENEWKSLNNVIQGEIEDGKENFKKFRPGTKYVKFVFQIFREDVTQNVIVDIKDIVLEEAE